MPNSMKNVVCLAMLGGILILAGCKPPDMVAGAAPRPAPRGKVSVHSLAGQFHMRVDQSSRSLAALAGPYNRILVLGQPDSRVYVNGRPIGEPGRVEAVGDVLFVPEDLAPKIRLALRGRPAEPPDNRGQDGPPEPPAESSPRMVKGLVVLDAGHGGKDPGASENGIREKELNLAVVQMVAENLKARGAKVVLTRSDDDTFVKLEDRAAMSNRLSADLFLSIHTNSSVKPGVCGFSVYVGRSASRASVAASTSIAQRIAQAGIEPCGSQPHRADFIVLAMNHRPAVLLEMGFLTNTTEAARLRQDSYQSKLAEAVADGIADFLSSKGS
jgi:N-acetylmuramoyl-L-alanine amidase